MNTRSSLPSIPAEAVYNPGFMVMYSNLSQYDWEATMKQDCFEILNHPVEEKQKKATSGMTMMSVLITLILFSAITIYQFPRLFKSYQEVGDNISTEIFTLMRY